MFGRRRRDPADHDTSSPAARERTAAADDAPTGAGDALLDDAKTPRPDGPHDASELSPEDARKGRVDLGGLLIRGVRGLKVQIQVDKRSGTGSSVVLGTGASGVQLMAVAAPRSSGLWGQTRMQMMADARRRGGTAEEVPGPFGTEARVVLPVTTSEGVDAVQPSRVSGIDGPRWMLRATFVGTATTDEAEFQRLVELVRGTVVVRGDQPMAPGDVIVLRPPPRVAAPSGTDADAVQDGTAAAPAATEPEPGPATGAEPEDGRA